MDVLRLFSSGKGKVLNGSQFKRTEKEFYQKVPIL
jgi:hypothetical protein